MSDALDNAFLRSLPPRSLEAFTDNLTPVAMPLGQILTRPGDTVNSVYFPISCLLSNLSVSAQGDTVETSMTGNEGASGLLEALGTGVVRSGTTVQVDGFAIKIPVALLRQQIVKDSDLLNLAWRLVEVQMVESRQSAMCNALHSVEPRFARWLLESSDRAGGRATLPLTQDFIASMLGVQRTTVSAFAAELQKAGLIAYRRGRVQVVDAAGLEHRSCECRKAVMETRRRTGLDAVRVPEDRLRLVSG